MREAAVKGFSRGIPAALPRVSARSRLCLTLVGAALLLSSCMSEPAAVSEGGLSLETFFDGHSVSHGTIDTLYFWTEPFRADFTGQRTENRLDLQEMFHFADGDRLQSWDLSSLPGGLYSGTVRTTLGSGRMSPTSEVTGYRTQQGAVLTYDGYAPGGGSTPLHFQHVMQEQDDGTVQNSVTVSKFGLPLAKATVVFSKPAPADAG